VNRFWLICTDRWPCWFSATLSSSWWPLYSFIEQVSMQLSPPAATTPNKSKQHASICFVFNCNNNLIRLFVFNQGSEWFLVCLFLWEFHGWWRLSPSGSVEYRTSGFRPIYWTFLQEFSSLLFLFANRTYGNYLNWRFLVWRNWTNVALRLCWNGATRVIHDWPVQCQSPSSRLQWTKRVTKKRKEKLVSPPVWQRKWHNRLTLENRLW